MRSQPGTSASRPSDRTADTLARYDSIRFLDMLQQAVASSNTPPLSATEQALSQRFDALFGDGGLGPLEEAQLVAGTRKA